MATAGYGRFPTGSRRPAGPVTAVGVGLICLALTLAVPRSARAASAEGQARPLSFEQSTTLLATQSDVLSGAEAQVRAARDHADSLKAMRWPVISLDAQQMVYQKTLDISLDDLKNRAQGSANSTLDNIEAQGVPGVPGGAVSAVIDQVRGTLPGLFSRIPNSVSYESRETLFHPTVTAILPLYAGGAIAAAQGGAQASAALAGATAEQTRQTLQLQLVQAYFGQVLAAQVQEVARETRDGFDHHLDNARKLEKNGQISRARTLQVEVARDASQRALTEAEGNYRIASDALANLLHSPSPIDPVTPLFVASAPLPSVAPFLASAQTNQPRLHQAQAAVEAARRGVDLARAGWLPTVYAFGEYNLNREHELVTEPDWVAGIGVHYTLMSNVDRSKSASAARARQEAAEAAERQVQTDIRAAITRAYNLVETARQQYLSLDSSVAAARESVRVQETSFREGVAASSDVIDARNALAQVRSQRAAAAYKYDLALASLLLVSGQGNRFLDYLHNADLRVSSHE